MDGPASPIGAFREPFSNQSLRAVERRWIFDQNSSLNTFTVNSETIPVLQQERDE